MNKDEWKKLEHSIFHKKGIKLQRVTIFSGLFLLPSDPILTYDIKNKNTKAQFQLPLIFWKVVYYRVGKELRKIAFVMSQKNKVKEFPYVQFSRVRTSKESAFSKRGTKDPFQKLSKKIKPFLINSSVIEDYTGLRFARANELFSKKEPLELIYKSKDTRTKSSAELRHRTPDYLALNLLEHI